MWSVPSSHSSLSPSANMILQVSSEACPTAWVAPSKMARFCADLGFPIMKLLFSCILPGCSVSSADPSPLHSAPVIIYSLCFSQTVTGVTCIVNIPSIHPLSEQYHCTHLTSVMPPSAQSEESSYFQKFPTMYRKIYSCVTYSSGGGSWRVLLLMGQTPYWDVSWNNWDWCVESWNGPGSFSEVAS